MEKDIVLLEMAVALRAIAPELHRSAKGKHTKQYETCKNPFCKLLQTVIAHSQDWHERLGYEEAHQIFQAVYEHKEHNK